MIGHHQAGFALVAVCCSAGTALAGLVRVSVDPGTAIVAGWTTVDGLEGTGATDKNSDGVIEFVIPSQNTVTGGVNICKQSDNRRLYYTLDLNVGGVTLPSLEPFDVPSFGSDAGGELVALVDISGLLSDGITFGDGETINIMNGQIDQTDRITFFDGSGLSDDPLLASEFLSDPANVRTLPTFSGNATVVSFDSFVPSPTATTTLLTGALLFGKRRRQSQSS